jgi:HlyD family secretion protein
MKKKKIAAIAVLVVLIIAVFVIYRYRTQKDDGTMHLSGNVEVTETNVAFKIPGRVIARLVDEGDKVKEGDVIARLDNAELTATEAQSRANLKEATTRLK